MDTIMAPDAGFLIVASVYVDQVRRSKKIG